ncbi:MAG: hypothetical protein WBI40_04265 [Methylococcaceae bacterium]
MKRNLFATPALQQDVTKVAQEIDFLQQAGLFTTEKILIANCKMLLPSKPDGHLVFNLAMIYNDNNVAEIHGASVLEENGKFYAHFGENEKVNGHFGVVSYLMQVTE